MTDREMLVKAAKQCERWAEESREGSWSTHQVDANRRLAEEIWLHLGNTGPPSETPVPRTQG